MPPQLRLAQVWTGPQVNLYSRHTHWIYINNMKLSNARSAAVRKAAVNFQGWASSKQVSNEMHQIRPNSLHNCGQRKLHVEGFLETALLFMNKSNRRQLYLETLRKCAHSHTDCPRHLLGKGQSDVQHAWPSSELNISVYCTHCSQYICSSIQDSTQYHSPVTREPFVTALW